jgi:ABC-type uncharacterized transport system substrate-binding protein
MESSHPQDRLGGGMARRLARWCCVLLLGLAWPDLHAAPREVFVVGETGGIHARITATTRDLLSARGVEVRLRELRPEALPAALAAAEQPGLVVTLGAQAAQALEGPLQIPVLHAAIARTHYRELLASGEPAMPPHDHSALFLDQPPERQVAAIQIALPQLQSIGMIASTQRADLLEPLARAAQAAGIEVVEATVTDETLLIPRVEQLLRYADALLITPDPSLYNRYTLQKVLLAAYRQRKPVIGLSSAYVRAGALLAVHAEPTAIGRDLAARIAEFVANGQLAPPGYPQHYAVAINQRVARSLGLNLPPEADLLEALQAREARP